MSCNKYEPHVFILPEDDANRQLANGFVLEVRYSRRIQVLQEAGGWLHVCETFLSEHVKEMQKYIHRYVVLLLDFDNQNDRPDKVKAKIPLNLADRVFLLGVRTEPEALRRAGLGSFEDIGRLLAMECRNGVRNVWEHDLLRQNAGELARLEQTVRVVLF